MPLIPSPNFMPEANDSMNYNSNINSSNGSINSSSFDSSSININSSSIGGSRVPVGDAIDEHLRHIYEREIVDVTNGANSDADSGANDVISGKIVTPMTFLHPKDANVAADGERANAVYNLMGLQVWAMVLKGVVGAR